MLENYPFPFPKNKTTLCHYAKKRCEELELEEPVEEQLSEPE
jgi:hypothetical protein